MRAARDRRSPAAASTPSGGGGRPARAPLQRHGMYQVHSPPGGGLRSLGWHATMVTFPAARRGNRGQVDAHGVRLVGPRQLRGQDPVEQQLHHPGRASSARPIPPLDSGVRRCRSPWPGQARHVPPRRQAVQARTSSCRSASLSARDVLHGRPPRRRPPVQGVQRLEQQLPADAWLRWGGSSLATRWRRRAGRHGRRPAATSLQGRYDAGVAQSTSVPNTSKAMTSTSSGSFPGGGARDIGGRPL